MYLMVKNVMVEWQIPSETIVVTIDWQKVRKIFSKPYSERSSDEKESSVL
jgi:hypothetical protein